MKILIDHQLPFMLAHGGLQIQIEQTKAGLEEAGLEVEYLRWWDDSQRGDIIHFFGRANPSHIDFAHSKGMKYVMSELFTGQGSRTPAQLRLQGIIEGVLRKVVPPAFLSNFRWDAYHKADALIVGTSWEAEVAELLFSPPQQKVHVVPNGVEGVFFGDQSIPLHRNRELVCTATIAPRKRVVELTEAAIASQTPLHIYGMPYGENDPYYKLFLRAVAKAPDLVSYKGPITDRAQLAHIYQTARGFVLLSSMETRSLSAEEAAAAGCPLLLSDLPWARSTFGDSATYCPVGDSKAIAETLSDFCARADSLPKPTLPCRWAEVAEQLLAIYRTL
jgi:glycosyltransferase involved in cell wall biosynthesis